MSLYSDIALFGVGLAIGSGLASLAASMLAPPSAQAQASAAAKQAESIVFQMLETDFDSGLPLISQASREQGAEHAGIRTPRLSRLGRVNEEELPLLLRQVFGEDNTEIRQQLGVPAEESDAQDMPAWMRMALQSQAAYDVGDTKSGHMFHEAAKLLLISHVASAEAAMPTPQPQRRSFTQ